MELYAQAKEFRYLRQYYLEVKCGTAECPLARLVEGSSRPSLLSIVVRAQPLASQDIALPVFQEAGSLGNINKYLFRVFQSILKKTKKEVELEF